jgi:Domain of unknown function (DUF4279)
MDERAGELSMPAATQARLVPQRGLRREAGRGRRLRGLTWACMSGIRQYVHFAIFSDTLTGADIANLVGLEPDRITVRGSRRTDPPIPRSHCWEVVCESKGMPIDEQVEAVLERLRPIESALADVTTSPNCTAVLQLVRYFDHEDGEPEEVSDPTDRLQKLPGQHQLLGWCLPHKDLAFLVRLGASIDADEYSGEPFKRGEVAFDPPSPAP